MSKKLRTFLSLARQYRQHHSGAYAAHVAYGITYQGLPVLTAFFVAPITTSHNAHNCTKEAHQQRMLHDARPTDSIRQRARMDTTESL